jgi:hypothetical protein
MFNLPTLIRHLSLLRPLSPVTIYDPEWVVNGLIYRNRRLRECDTQNRGSPYN